VQILYSRRYLFLLTAATVSLIVVVYTFFIPKQYEAKSTVFIEKNVVNSLLEGITITPSMSNRIRVLRYHMLSRDIISRVLKKLDMDVKTQTSERFESLVKECQEKTDINMKGDDLFFVSMIDSEPAFARDYINTLVNTYVEENLSSKREESFGADRFLSEQVSFYKHKLNTIEDKIHQYRRETGIFSTITEASIIEEIDALTQQLRELQGKKNELIATVRTINDQLNSMQESAANGGSFAGLDMLLGSQEEMRIESLNARLDELLLVYNESYPEVVKIREQIQALQERQKSQPEVETEVNSEVFNPVEDPVFVDLKMRMNATQSDLNALKARETELQAQVDANKQMLDSFPHDKKVLAEMERERAMVKNVYETLLQRVGMAEVSKQMEVADKATTFRIVDPAILPTSPAGTKRLYKMAFGLIVGIGAGLGAVVVREQFDDTVQNADDLRARGITVLAEIPLMLNAKDIQKRKKKDRLVYSYCCVCLLFIGLFMLHDLLGLDVLDRLLGT